MYKNIVLLLIFVSSLLAKTFVETYTELNDYAIISNFDKNDWIINGELESINNQNSLTICKIGGVRTKIIKEFKPSINLSKYDNIIFEFSVSDINNINWNKGGISLYLKEEVNSVNYFVIELSYKIFVLNSINGFYQYYVSIHDASISKRGNPSWSDIGQIEIALEVKENKQVLITFDKLKVNKNKMDIGYLMLTADDASSTIYTHALPLFNKYGFKMTVFAIGKFIGTKGYCDTIQLDSLYRNGFEIGSHTWSHQDLTKLTVYEINKECIDNINFLKKRGYNTYSLFAFPYGATNSTVNKVIDKYHPFARCVSGLSYKGIYSPYHSSSYVTVPILENKKLMPGLMYDTTMGFTTHLKPLIDNIVSKKMCGGILFHKFSDNEKKYLTIDTMTLDSVLSYAKLYVDNGLLNVGGMGGKGSPIKLKNIECIL